MKTKLTKVSGVPADSLYFVRTEKCPKYHFGSHRHHDFYDMTYVVSGRLFNRINGNVIEQFPGSLLLVNVNDIHEVWGEDVEFINLVFFEKEIRNLMRDMQSSFRDGSRSFLNFDRTIVSKIPENERPHFEVSMRNLMNVHGKPQALLAFRIFLYRTIMEYFFPDSSHHIQGDEMPDWIIKCLNEIHNGHERNWTLNGIRQICGRSKEHICRAFRKHLGITPSQLINEYRLERAGRLLRFTNQTVSEISFGTGFNNLSYFNRIFLKKYGTSPVKYRKIHKFS
ncbi:MAG TPA: hypothetical protein DET40_06300 [Lentisphaeria bacterium]|nr:MAG: hypothetical protein A2X45_17830 [Lentisphaerae bacterium GWF2_50_93]HCE43138.1 hypothetical protein [Lentisphaeria bacterium]